MKRLDSFFAPNGTASPSPDWTSGWPCQCVQCWLPPEIFVPRTRSAESWGRPCQPLQAGGGPTCAGGEWRSLSGGRGTGSCSRAPRGWTCRLCCSRRGWARVGVLSPLGGDCQGTSWPCRRPRGPAAASRWDSLLPPTPGPPSVLPPRSGAWRPQRS